MYIIDTIVKAVFNFPDIPAGITTPSPLAISLKPDTINSLEAIIIKGTQFIKPTSVKQANADITRTLSASGSKNFPKFVTRLFFLAI